MNNKKLKVASYNIGSVLSEIRRDHVLRHLQDSTEIVDIDVLCLQEVFLTWGEKKLAEEKWIVRAFPYSVYGENAQFKDGCMGNVTLSKYPIKEWENFDLSVKGRESRGCLSTFIDLPEQITLEVLNVHLGLRHRERQQQFKFLLDYAGKAAAHLPIILAGDFNDWKSALHTLVMKNGIMRDASEDHLGKLTKTFPSILPLFPLDRLYYRNLHLHQFCRYYKGWRGVSDHLPVVAMFSY